MTARTPFTRSLFTLAIAIASSVGVSAWAQTIGSRSASETLAAVEGRVNQQVAASLAGSSVVTIPVKANTSVPVYVRVGRITTLSFQQDETIATVMYDDKEMVEDFISPDQRRLTLRMKRPITLPGTVITNKRNYFFTLTPTEAPDQWYQGVTFGPESATNNPFGVSVAAGEGNAAAPVSVADAAPIPQPNNDVFSGTPNFNYTITGTADFRPVAVYDNGRFTWIQMPSNGQTLPAVFAVGPNGIEVVNFVPHNNGTALLVNRLMSKFVLQVGAAQVTVTANR